MVAISDGVSVIQNLLLDIFGVLVVIILDWYNDRKKVCNLFVKIARNKPEKTKHLEFLLYHLWHGQTQEVLDYLNNNVKAKNGDKLRELIGYIEKHQFDLIDYDRRKKIGKIVGLKPEGDIENQSSVQPVKKAGSENVFELMKTLCELRVENRHKNMVLDYPTKRYYS